MKFKLTIKLVVIDGFFGEQMKYHEITFDNLVQARAAFTDAVTQANQYNDTTGLNDALNIGKGEL